ncbi:hypothetical protein D3C87_1650000 [compost metagenome]
MPDDAHGAGQFFLHVLQSVQQAPGFVLGACFDTLAQIAAGHGFGRLDGARKRAGDGPGDPPGEQRAQRHGDARQREVQSLCLPDDLLAGDTGLAHFDGLQPGKLDDAVLQAVEYGQRFFQQALTRRIAFAVFQQCAHRLEGFDVSAAHLFQRPQPRAGLFGPEQRP